MRKISRGTFGLALFTALALTAQTLAGASESSSSESPHGDYPTTGSSAIDAASAAAAASSLSSDVPLSSGPAVSSSELAEGPLGSALYELNSSLGSSDVSQTFPSENAGVGEFRGIRHLEGDVYEFDVYSPSMDRIVTNDIYLPGGPDNTAERPTFYLMMGADGARGGWSWYNSSNYQEFFADKLVNVVTPKGATSSMQADWYRFDPTTGDNKWTTYMTKELPPLVDDLFHGTGQDAIGGISMSGGPAIELASLEPARFRAAASYSGCPSTTGVAGQAFARFALSLNDADPDNMWGGSSDPAWAAHSPVLHLDRLQNTEVFVGAAQGTPGPVDGPDYSSRVGNPQAGIEAASYVCSSHFVDRAREAGVSVEFYPLAEGTHTWGLFEDQMRRSWTTTIGPALGF